MNFHPRGRRKRGRAGLAFLADVAAVAVVVTSYCEPETFGLRTG